MAMELLEIEPQELKFVFEVKKQTSCAVHLTNKSDDYVAFKVKTTSPRRYCVRPNAGIVLPRSTLDFTVTLQPQKVAPTDMQCRDKFLVQSTVVPYGTKEDEMKPEYFSKESGKLIEEIKLKVIFDNPSHSPVLQQLNGSHNREAPVKEKIYEVSSIKEPSHVEEVAIEYSLPKEAPILKEAPVVEEAPVVKEPHVQKDREFTGYENLHRSADTKDLMELKSTLHNLEAKLSQAEKLNATLEEEKSSLEQEKAKMQKELVMLRRMCMASVRIGYPPLFVCFIGLVCLALGYLSCK